MTCSSKLLNLRGGFQETLGLLTSCSQGGLGTPKLVTGVWSEGSPIEDFTLNLKGLTLTPGD